MPSNPFYHTPPGESRYSFQYIVTATSRSATTKPDVSNQDTTIRKPEFKSDYRQT